jgi:hypothetical protein
MKKQIRLLGIIYIAFGCLLAVFALVAIVGAIAESLHLVKRGGGPPGGLGSAFIILILVGTLASWFISTGLGLMRYQPSARMYALVVSGVLLFGLNVILMLTQDQPQKVGRGFTIFHLICIGLGLYGLLLLLSKSGRQSFQ